MKIQIISDLHLEFLSPSQIQKIIDKIGVCGDVLVLAGDVGDGMADHYRTFLEKMSAKFKKIFLVAGNHEYYGNDIGETNSRIRSICDGLTNTTFLCSSFEDYLGFRWIGCTLWSHISSASKCFTNDTRCIKNMPVSKYNQRHSDNVRFLRETLHDSMDKQCIVITHYLPSMDLIHERHRNDGDQPYNQWFASSLDDIIQEHTDHVPLWAYGHTHDPSRVRMFQTEMVCNPHGYDGENKHPDLCFSVELE